ncbi:MAG: hypothetical protein COT74_10110 [Bdellovibrionales bacterium CG10_big_fil_rev_8_21_14_0_10_45_34]|nr:MAG: hypothetical protein COT74_10110 [Bdellovibrionales bacterium CG10_big_fil_rev_8_21_14_0_10_45_34]
MSTYLLFGGSRGLGRSFRDLVLEQTDAKVAVVSRTYLKQAPAGDDRSAYIGGDLSQTETWEQIAESVEKHDPTYIIYFAAGGPWGEYGRHEWKDHLWAFQVSFMAPAFFLHRKLMIPGKLKKFIAVGSAVAEAEPDPNAASYAAAKHALKGLISSVQAENPPFDVRLFSPGYMDTPLLSKNAWPRHSAKLLNPNLVAQALFKWTHDPNHCNSHMVLQDSNSPLLS